MLDQKIETFLNVVRLKSYTATAQVMHLTQPAITQHIRKLEEYYNCQFVDSSHRTIHITEAGMLLYEYLSLQQANELRFSGILDKLKKPLCFGASLSIADYYIAPIVANYMLHDPMRIRMDVQNTANLLIKLKNGELDCALIEGIFDSSLFETKIFCCERFIPVVSASHPFANQPCCLDDLTKYPLVLREPKSGTREIFEQWLYQENNRILTFSNIMEVGSFTLIKELVANSFGITFVYEGVVREELTSGKLAVLHLERNQITHPFLFVYRKGDPNSDEIVQLYQTLYQEYQRNQIP